MALNSKDLYKGRLNPFDEAAKGARALLIEFEKLIVKGKEVSDALRIDIKANKANNTEDLKKLTEQTGKLGTATKAGNEIIKEKQKLEKTLKKLNSDKIQQNEQLKVQVQAQRKNNKELARDQLKLIGSYEKLTKKTNEAQRKFKNLATTFGENSKQAKKAKTEFEKLDDKLGKVNKAARDGRRDVGQYAKGWQGLKKLFVGGLGVLGVTAGFSAIRSGITKLVTTFSEFQKQVSKVGAISGASKDDLKALTAQAQALGEATEKTASEVAQLQLELAKLGFDPKQIQNATNAILDLSTAIDSDLGESAKVVGSTLRAFGLEAEETGRVTDVMASAFSKSSLDIAKFSTAMGSVAPVARKFGFSLEETTSLLAQLTDAGFEASSAGTATRKILLNLADTNGKLAKSLGQPVDNLEDLLQGLNKLNKEGTDLGEALELTDVRSVAAFATFLEGTDKTRKLAKELESAKGSAESMARIMRDNLAGDTDKAKSAMQGLFINIGKRLNPAMREATQNFTGLIGKLNELVKVKASEEIEKERTEVIKLVSKLQDANTSYEDRIILLDQLKDLAPDVVKGINAEEIAYEDLNKQLDAYLERVIERIAIAELEQEREEQLIKIASLKLKQTEILFEAQNVLVEVSKNLRESEGALQDQISGTIELLKKEVEAQKASGDAGELLTKKGQGTIDTRTKEQIQLSELIGAQALYNDIEIKTQRITEKTVSQINEKIQILKEQLGITENLNNGGKKNVEISNEATQAIYRYIESIERLKDIAAGGITTKLGTEFEDQKTDNEKFIDDLVNRNAQKSIDATDELIKNTQDRQKTIEDLEKEHYNSLLGIAFNYSNRKAAQDESLSNEELQVILSDNAQKEAAYQQLADTLISIGQSILQSQLDNINTEIQAKNQQINEQQQLLNRELQLLKEGAANEYNTEKAKLEALQEERNKDIKERERIQKKQETINTLTQVSELATAVATIINSAVSELGWAGVVAGLAAAAAAIIGFTTYKGEAESAASAEEGGMFTGKGTHVEKGKRHSKGGNKYSAVEFEKDEIHSIFSRKASKKHGNLIEDFTNAVNNDNVPSDQLEMYSYSLSQLEPNNTIINNDYSDLLSEMKNVSYLLSSRKMPIFDQNGKLRLYDNHGTLKKQQI